MEDNNYNEPGPSGQHVAANATVKKMKARQPGNPGIMKIRYLHQPAHTALRHPTGLLISLRHGKIMINTLLRWCSGGLMASYILTVIAGIRFYNQLILTSPWIPGLILALFVLLFACLLYIQYHYSEKCAKNLPSTGNAIKLDAYEVDCRYKSSRQRIVAYIGAVLIAGLVMTELLFSNLHAATDLVMISGSMLYGFGLYMTRELLMEKCAIRQMIAKFTQS
ncbi:MAG TPA: hypothetical protein VNW95_00410 [Mucilaginibacter sp.]|nr:hypothetical protein [Mucilaginibacter sp.]